MIDTLLDSTSKVQFAGHETFPLRLLWLKKAYDAAHNGADRGTFQEQSAIARFGVGRNMLLAIRHWAVAAGVIRDVEGQYLPGFYGDLLLNDETGCDPYLEDPASAWIVHYLFAGSADQTTTFYVAFNTNAGATFDRATLVAQLSDLADGRKGWRATEGTLKRDVEVFVRSYISRGVNEEASEPLLAELGLLREVYGTSGQFEFVRGPKPTLPDGVFAWALFRYWQERHPNSPTLSMEQICYGIGSPGRVFKLDEESVHTRLSKIATTTNGACSWTDTAGLRQVIWHREPDDEKMLRSGFRQRLKVVA